MQARSVRHLAAIARDRRMELNLSQAKLAAAAGVSRQWVVAFEAGKSTVELGNALRVIRALGLALDVSDAQPHTAGVDVDRLVDG